MAKKDLDIEKQQLEQEVLALRQKVADQERISAEINALSSAKLQAEMNAIRRKGNSKANRITVTEQIDHRNVSLWTKWGKRIGPMHPDNAVALLQERIGQLSSIEPTLEQIEKYKQSDEFKKMLKDELTRRNTRIKSRRSGQLEDLAQKMAAMHGVTVKELNQLKSPAEVGV